MDSLYILRFWYFRLRLEVAIPLIFQNGWFSDRLYLADPVLDTIKILIMKSFKRWKIHYIGTSM